MTEQRDAADAGVKEFCAAMDQWADLVVQQRGNVTGADTFEANWQQLRLAIRKSCLLDRTMYCGEKPSQTPCPVHQGKWAGRNWAWPGWTQRALMDHGDRKKGDIWLVTPDGLQKEWYDAGCRCAYHLCGCTTGWQPDEHCGCGGEERLRAEIAKHGLSY